MYKFFAKKIIDNKVYLFDNDIKHLTNVLRIKLNEQILITYENIKYLAQVDCLNPLRISIVEQLKINTNNNFTLNVYCASIKANYLEIAINKATELNVNNFYIFNSYYSQRNIVHNLTRYQKIIENASKQSNRTNYMQIKLINDDQTLINSLNENDLNLIADFNQQTFKNQMLENNHINKIGLLIGPEGGFSEQDYTLFKNINNLYTINLSKTILRTETALICLVAIINYLMNLNI